jgi:release factor glutamine methyltransferase
VTAATRPLRGVTVREALDSARVPLQAAGVDSPRLDAELLLAAVLGVDRAALLAHPERTLAPGRGRAFAELVRRRREREPVAYILGRRAFRALELAVDPRVLVPRPETETLVEAAVELLPRAARVLDVGTGSGAVALALKHERPDLEVTGSDASADALAVAGENARRLGLDVALVHADLVAPGDWDAVVSNPPYVAEGDLEALAPEIVRHEPPQALRAGPDGLAVLRALVAVASAPLLAVEVGAGQAPAVSGLMRAAGRSRLEARRDLAGIERVVVGWR